MHLSENVKKVDIIYSTESFVDHNSTLASLPVIFLPFYESIDTIENKAELYKKMQYLVESDNNVSTIAIICSPIFAADFCSTLTGLSKLQLWIAVELKNPIVKTDNLNQNHGAILIFTKYKTSLRHTKTRISYTYCPSCNKTTKDYGGKKHLYHSFGTAISDVWKDIYLDFNKIPVDILRRLADIFGTGEFSNLVFYDERQNYSILVKEKSGNSPASIINNTEISSKLVLGDSLAELKNIADDSIDFIFADPPYNLKKKYDNWDDSIAISNYFEWCDNWISECARILKPGCTLAILNIPQWCIRHYKFLVTVLDFQDWIVWDGLSMPVRQIMPAHYSVLCFSKGKPRTLPGLSKNSLLPTVNNHLYSLKKDYCIRQQCISKREKSKTIDREYITNLWTDIHRIKHNSKRVDHPCQLPPSIMYRLIELFTNENEIVLDPFNGAGTTTLCAAQLHRNFIGIELSPYYHEISSKRHENLVANIDPFGKQPHSEAKAKNSPIKRVQKQKYVVDKKTLQLEIKSISEKLGYIPSKKEVADLSSYPYEYYENYFTSWNEATAAAKTTGMSEFRQS